MQDGETGNGHGRNRWDAPWVKFGSEKLPFEKVGPYICYTWGYNHQLVGL